jgi:hypothetical protein
MYWVFKLSYMTVNLQYINITCGYVSYASHLRDSNMGCIFTDTWQEGNTFNTVSEVGKPLSD